MINVMREYVQALAQAGPVAASLDEHSGGSKLTSTINMNYFK